MADRETEGQTDRQRYRQREVDRDREGERERVIDVLYGISHICHLFNVPWIVWDNYTHRWVILKKSYIQCPADGI